VGGWGFREQSDNKYRKRKQFINKQETRSIPQNIWCKETHTIYLNILHVHCTYSTTDEIEPSVQSGNIYLCTWNLYGAVRSGFDAGECLYAGKWEAVEAWKSRNFQP